MKKNLSSLLLSSVILTVMSVAPINTSAKNTDDSNVVNSSLIQNDTILTEDNFKFQIDDSSLLRAAPKSIKVSGQAYIDSGIWLSPPKSRSTKLKQHGHYYYGKLYLQSYSKFVSGWLAKYSGTLYR